MRLSVSTESGELSLLEKIGEGAQSVVYRGVRGEETFAVKLQRAGSGNLPSSEETARFWREAGTMARLSHAGLPFIVEVGEKDGLCFLVMQYQQARTLADALARGPLGVEVTLRMARTVAGALAEVHRHLLVHRDIKPQNILFTASGTFQLIDFGFAAQADQHSSSAEVLGTFQYTAPEQTGLLKRPVDGRADLYSLGVVLYECLTGILPFTATDVGELMRQHAAVVAPSVRVRNPQVGPALARVVEKLLAKDPDDRYQSGEDLQRDLDRLPELESTLAQGGTLRLGGTGAERRFSAPTPLIGRQEEVARLEARWHGAHRGEGSALLVEGAPGSGKSRLVGELLGRVQESKTLLLRGKCTPSDPTPFAFLREALRAHLRWVMRLPSGEGEVAMDHLRQAVGEYLPLLQRLSGELAVALGGAPAPDAAVEHEQFAQIVADFLLRLARQHAGLVLFVDDAQWLDSASRQVLRALVPRLREQPLLVVAAARNDEASAQAVEALVREVGLHPDARLSLRPLDQRGVGQLVAAHLGGDVDPQLVAYIALRSEGSPLAVGEYARALLEGGYLRFAARRWVIGDQGLERLELPGNVLELMVHRIGLLDEHARRVLAAAAILGSRFSLQLLPQVAAESGDAVRAAVMEAVRARLVEQVDAGVFAFIHDRVQEALLMQLSEEAQRHLHQRAAEALEGVDSDAPSHLYALARHHQHGEWERDAQRTSRACYRAGLAALASFAPEEAHGYLEQAARAAQAAGLPASAELEEHLGSACIQTGRLTLAVKHLQQALALEAPPVMRARLHGRLAQVHMARYNGAHAWQELEAGLEALGHPFPRSTVRQVSGSLWDWSRARMLEWRGARSALPEERERLQALAQLYAQGFLVSALTGDDLRTPQMAVRLLYVGQQLGPSRELVTGLSQYGLLLSIIGRREAASRMSARAVALAEQLGDRALIAQSEVSRAFVAEFSGERTAAAQLERVASSLGRWLETGDLTRTIGSVACSYYMRGYPEVAVSWSIHRADERLKLTRGQELHLNEYHPHDTYALGQRAMLGQWPQAREHLRRAEAFAAEFEHDRFLRGALCWNKLVFLLEEGAPSAALDEVIARFEQLGFRPDRAMLYLRFFYVFCGYARDVQLRDASGPERTARLAQLRQAVGQLRTAANHPLLHSHLHVLEGALARAEGRHTEAEEAFSSAERFGHEIDSPWILYEVALRRARHLAAGGHLLSADREARRALQLAVAGGWEPRVRRLEREFQLVASSEGPPLSQPAASRSSGASSVLQQRKLDALLQVGLSVAHVRDPAEHARTALDVLLRLLGAERACLFLSDPSGEQLSFVAGRDSAGEDMPAPSGYSTTLVERVRTVRQPMVVSGSEQGLVLGSRSAVAYDLRSIAAAPLMLRERLVGVVYLDSRMARGVFTEADAEILMVICNHIAVGLESVRAAQLEREQWAMQKDLALTAAVQTLFLPRKQEAEFSGLSLAGFYQPAAQCGGDWWSWEVQQDGVLRLLMGDVTGHGPASAMVTAAAAGVCRALAATEPDATVLLGVLHSSILSLCQGSYWMTFSVVDINLATGRLRLCNAGAPPPLLQRANEVPQALVSRSTPLGGPEMVVAVQEHDFLPGDRLLLYTDGLPEQETAGGRPLGMRQLRNLLRSAPRASPPEARTHLAAAVCAPGITLADDVTFVLVERQG